ncbi:MAG: HD domain-containing protein [Candidatus Woesearchaeota archaeon]
MSEFIKILSSVEKLILDLAKIEDNNNKSKIWSEHITKVVFYSKKLANDLGADVQVCTLAAWLHDISKIEGTKKDHHIIGANRAKEILTKLNYDVSKIKLVQDAILTHSSDDNYPPVSLEQKIVACADALAWLDDFLLFVHGIHFIKGLSKEEAISILKKKMLKAKNKTDILPKAKELAEPKLKAINFLLDLND